MAANVGAETYYPDADGEYTVELKMQANNEYVLFVIKGEYDQTNYIEAFNAAKDEDIIYYEQKLSDAEGNVVFDSFVPLGYYNATLILGGSSLDEPYLAGHLSVGAASNTGSIVISGIEQSYTVSGINGSDIAVDVETQVLDSFGYPSFIDEEVTLSLSGNSADVVLEGNRITIDKAAKEQLFFVNASVGTATAQVKVYVKRETSAYSYIEIYTDEDCTQAVSEVSLKGVAGSAQSITLYAKSFDQYGQELADTYSYVFGGNVSTSTVTPLIGTTAFVVRSMSSPVEKTINIIVNARPDYQESALELYELIVACEEELSKLGTEKFVSAESGKDVYPEDVWTTNAYVTNFTEELNTAKAALDNYGSEGYGDADYSDEVTALTKANGTYLATFKAGVRKDITEISINEQNVRVAAGAKPEYTLTTNPRLTQTTDKITWTTSDDTVATVDSNGVVTALKSGKVTITATTRAGLTATTELTVYKKATKILVTPSSATATYGSESTVITAKIYPSDSTDEIVWDVANPDLAYLVVSEPVVENDYLKIEATVVPKSAGKCNVTVTAVGANKSATSALTVKMPAWETASAPVASIESGTVLAGTSVTLSTETENTTIYYTLDGSTPSKTNGRLYKNPIVINQSLTLKAIAVGAEMYDSAVSVYEYDLIDTSVTVSSETVRSGEVFTVYVDVDGFEDLDWASIVLEYDASVMMIEDYGWNRDYAVDFETVNDGIVKISYSNRNGVHPDGELAYFQFKAADDAPEGEYMISVTEARVLSTDDSIGELGEFDAVAQDGVITVNNYIIGDANDDGKIGLADALIIKQYLAGNKNAIANIVLGAADVDADGDVDNDDLTLLSKYCVGWNVTLG